MYEDLVKQFNDKYTEEEKIYCFYINQELVLR